MNNYSDELIELLEVASEIAISIRLNTSYNPELNFLSRKFHLPQKSQKTEAALKNVLEFSNAIHNFEYLAKAFKSNDAQIIIAACEFHIDTFISVKKYLSTTQEDIWQKLYLNSFDKGIEIFERIIIKSKKSGYSDQLSMHVKKGSSYE